MPTCCVILADGVSRCTRNVASEGDICWQHRKLKRSCPYSRPGTIPRQPVKQQPIDKPTRGPIESLYEITPAKEPENPNRPRLPDVILQPDKYTGHCGSRLGLCRWPNNLNLRDSSQHSYYVDILRLFGELHNHTSVHDSGKIKQLETLDPSTYCDLLHKLVWPSDAWLDSQYDYIKANANTRLGKTWKDTDEHDPKYRKWTDVNFGEYIMRFKRNFELVELNRPLSNIHPDNEPVLPKLKQLLLNSTPTDADFYVWRELSYHTSIDWSKFVLSNTIFHPDDLNPYRTSIDSNISIHRAVNRLANIEQVQYGQVRGLLMRILIPKGSRGVLPVGRFSENDKDDINAQGYRNSLYQEIWLPPGAKVRLLPETMKRSEVMFKFMESPEESMYTWNKCEFLQMLTVECIYEGA